MKHDRLSSEFADAVYPGLDGEHRDETERICRDIEESATNSIRWFLMSGITVIALIIISIMTENELIANISITFGTVFTIICGVLAVYYYGRHSLIRPLLGWIEMKRMVEESHEEERND